MMEKRRKYTASQGFTLVELAIVLVVVGLVSAGVLIGQHVINGAKIKNTISQMRSYETAVNIFELKYHALPGDMKHPELFNFDAVSSSERGNGLLTADETHDENKKFWRHLSQAKLIDGGFDGTTSHYGTGAPHTQMNKVGMYVAGRIFLFPDRNVFVLGLDEFDSNTYHIIPSDAWQLDRKMDDGLPTNGLMRAPNPGFSPYCYATGSPDEYNLLFDVGLCAVFARMSF